ncbi:MAG: tetratricopeptide repeat protein, partial [Sulfuricellaceae bacterium]|nr:tetratricopeptide repeat protein [Sulfuricellaceae bacterium]
VQLHQSGRLVEGAHAYRLFLEKFPENADVLHLLGVLEFQLDHPAEAECLLKEAIRINKDLPDVYFNLGFILYRQGKFLEAEELLRIARDRRPSDSGVLNNLGNALAAQGKLGEAERVFDEALRLAPANPELLFNLGNVFKQSERYAEAEKRYLQALALKQDYVDAGVNLGFVLWKQKRIPEAEAHFRAAIESQAGNVDAANNLGAMLRECGRLDEAEAILRQLVARRPGFAEAWNNLGVVLEDLWRLDEAQVCFRKAIEIRPNYAFAYNNLGKALMYFNIDESVAAFQKALLIDGGYVNAHWNLGVALLLRGDFHDAWPEFEQRLNRKEVAAMYAGYAAPLWQGEALQGNTILLHAEQGLGDTIHFIRFAQTVARRGGRVIVECQPPLKQLLQSVEGIDAVYAKGEPLTHYDLHLPLMSLPYRLGIDSVDSIPVFSPYIHAEAERAKRWGARIDSAGDLTVGLVWAGDPRKTELDSHLIDKRRSIELRHYAPLLPQRGVRFFSLQKGEAASQVAQFSDSITDFMPEIDDFADTAALISHLDLVISVDTSVAHLAAAMGKPVWLLSRFDGCWRWLLGRDDTPWYPSMRLFRQRTPGDWTPVIDRIRSELSEWVKK